MKEKIAKYVSKRLSEPFNWTGLTTAEMIRAGRIDRDGAAKSLIAEFDRMEEEEVKENFPDFPIFGNNEICVNAYFEFACDMEREIRKQVFEIED